MMCEIKACLPKIIITSSCMLKLQKVKRFLRQHCIDNNLWLGMAVLICVQNLAGTGLGVAPKKCKCKFWNINAGPATLQGCIPCVILMKSSGFLGISVSDLNSQFDCICLSGLDFIGVLSLGCMFPQIFLCGVMRRWFICSVWRYIIVCLFTWLPTAFRPHYSTAYMHAAYCFRPSSMVCRSVSLSH